MRVCAVQTEPYGALSGRQRGHLALRAASGLLVLLFGSAATAAPVRTALDNGLKVCIAEDDATDTVALAILVRATADCEPDDKAGLRIVVQHALQAGLSERLESDPGLGGLLDAEDSGGGASFSSEWEYVWLGYEGMSQTLPDALPVLATALFRPQISEAHFAAAREQVLAAVEGPVSAPAASTMGLFRLALLGRASRAYPLGTPGTINGLTLGDATAFHRRYYVPALSTVAVVGPVDAAQTQALIARCLGDLPAGDANLPPAPPTLTRPDVHVAANARLSPGSDQHMDIASLVVGVPAPGLGDPDEGVTHVIHALLAGGTEGGRLERDDHLWQSLGFPSHEGGRRRNFVESLQPPTSQRGHLAIHAYAAPRQAETVREALLKQFDDLRAHGAQAGELATAKDRTIGALTSPYDLPSNRALLMGRACLLGEADSTGRSLIQQVAEVTVEDVQRVARAWFGVHAVGLELPEP